MEAIQHVPQERSNERIEKQIVHVPVPQMQEIERKSRRRVCLCLQRTSHPRILEHIAAFTVLAAKSPKSKKAKRKSKTGRGMNDSGGVAMVDEAVNEARQTLAEQQAELEVPHRSCSCPECATCFRCGASVETCVGVADQHCFD